MHLTTSPSAYSSARIFYMAIIMLVSAPVLADKAQPDFDNIRSGTLYLNGADSHHDAVLLNSKVSMHIAGVVADIQLSQDFENTSTEWVEGIYAFPLPDNASVRSMQIRIGERTIKGQVVEKQKADKQYHQAAAEGRVAGLVKQERSNLFTTRIANIAPGEKVQVALDYFQTLEINKDQISLKLPTTFTPRYFPPQSENSDNQAERPRKTLLLLDENEDITPEFLSVGSSDSHQLALQIAIESDIPVTEISSESHTIDVTEQENIYLISSSNGHIPMDRDFTLRWKFSPSTTPQPALYTQDTEQGRFSLMVINPPISESSSPPTTPREVIFVLDTSGSMAGNSIRSAKSAISEALAKMSPKDRFNIVQFNDSARQLFKESQPATQNLLSTAISYINTLDADGGTEMRAAIDLALKNQTHGYLRQIVFITDGSVGNEQEIFRIINQQLDQARLFTVGIGTAPNTFFMRQAAQVGRGSYRYIANPEKADVEISALLDQMTSPVLTSIRISDNTGELDYRGPVPDLYKGDPLIIPMKLSKDTSSLKLQGEYNGKVWEKTIPVIESDSTASGIASLWARQNIEHLMNDQWLQNDNKLHRDEIINLSRSFGVLSQWTSFLAVEEKVVRNARQSLKTQPLNNLLPASGSVGLVNLPQGATAAKTWIFGALILLLVLFAINADRLRLDPQS